MPQKILAGRANDPQLRGDLVQVKVDQIILCRAPGRALAEGLAAGLKRTNVEVAVVYDGVCVSDANSLADVERRGQSAVAPELPAYNVPIARPGIGFPAPVHLERFAAPARLALTDDPRMAPVGGIGMLSLVVSPVQLGVALATGSIWLRPPRSVQIHLSGKVRPFVCARDVALELLRRDIGQVIQRIEAEFKAPVVLEFAGPSARFLSVQERAVLAGIAPQLGAAAALFVSDEKTEVFLRDQRRSKAHRALVPDPGAPCEEVISIDLATVDPLLMDEQGVVRPVRDLAGKPVSQVVLGGDSGVTLRDMLAAALLLKSKRVPSRLDLLVAPPSRQMLEVLAQSGALVDLVATGARIIEPDQRVVSGEMYPPPSSGISMRTFDPEPRSGGAPSFVIASAETAAFAVATGAVGDPRNFKRPVRVTVPRALPTDDVLVVRDKKGDNSIQKKTVACLETAPWKSTANLRIVHGLSELVAANLQAASNGAINGSGGADVGTGEGGAEDGTALLLSSLDEVRALIEHPAGRKSVRAVLAPFMPSCDVATLASEGIAAFGLNEKTAAALKGQSNIGLPSPSAWGDTVSATAGKAKVEVEWLAVGAERDWTHRGSSNFGPPPPKPAASNRGRAKR